MVEVLSRKLYGSQIQLAEHAFRHHVLTLKHEQTIAELRETPSLWSAIQSDLGKRLLRGDMVTIVSPDGLTIADQCPVVRAESGSVWLGKPLRMIEIEEVGLYSDGHYEVVPNGTGYSIRNIRDGRMEELVYGSVEAARQEIIKRAAVKAA